MIDILVIILIIVTIASCELLMGRKLLPTKGLRLFGGNSQMLVDWYSLSHIIHGFIFFALFNYLEHALLVAILLEGFWEILENSPLIINRYRQTASTEYNGDTVVNSISDILFMTAGFLAASQMSWCETLGLAVTMELVALAAIRDNLVLNIIMLIYPSDKIKKWQTKAN